MPFDCGNMTLPYPNCYSLLKYCNNNYGSISGWCHCMATVDFPNCHNNESSLQIAAIIIIP
jgi:hypothetical protein